MSKSYPKVSFWLPYILSLVFVISLFLSPRLLAGPPWFVWLIIFILVINAVLLALLRSQNRLKPQDIPETYSPQHFLLLLWFSAQAFILCLGLHNAFYALFWHAVKLFDTGDEPVFFIIALLVVPAGFIAGAVSRLWIWAVVEPVKEMADRGVHLPGSGRYFLPIGSYIWLWQFGRGVELLTRKRIRAGGVFCAVFFLGVLGFVIIRKAAQFHMKALAAG